MTQRRTSLIVVATALCAMASGLLVGGCQPECVAGQACLCEGGSCDLVCEGDDGGGCDFECTDGADCTASCPGGGCTMECSGAASCALDCPGDSCTMNCTDTDTCNVDSCGANCPLNCGGAASCDNSCDIMSACPTTP